MTPEQKARDHRIRADKTRLSNLIFALGKQLRDRSIMDSFLGNLSGVTAIDGRLPFTPRNVITTQNRVMLLHNLMAHAVIKWGILARGEGEPANPELDLLEEVAKNGFVNYGAWPKDRNSAIMVLRTATEERAIREKWRNASDRALEMKSKILDRQETPKNEPKQSGGSVGDPEGELLASGDGVGEDDAGEGRVEEDSPD